MRYSLSSRFAFAHTDWQDAYAKHNQFADAGDDQGRAAKEASEAEYKALDALLLTPCRHPGDVAAKLDLVWQRDLHTCADFDRLRDSLKRDLAEIARPNASERMKVAWARFASARVAAQTFSGSDEDALPIDQGHMAAFDELLAVPCATPGDLLVKAYVGMLEGCLNLDAEPNLLHFEISEHWREPDTNYLIDRAHAAMIDDIENCDLGRCMISLGSLDFEPRAWIAAAKRANVTFGLIVRADGTRGFYFSEFGRNGDDPVGRKREMRVRALINFNHEERYREVADEIEFSHPELITRVGEEAAQQEAA